MTEEKIDELDNLILGGIKRSQDKGINTYRLSKDLGICWSTVNVRCYHMQALGILTSEFKTNILRRRERIWRLKD